MIIETNEELWDSTEGLCGNPNGNPYDDFALPEEGGAATTAAQLAEAWRSWEGACEGVGGGGGGEEGGEAGPPCDEEEGEKAALFCKALIDSDTLDECRKVRRSMSTLTSNDHVIRQLLFFPPHPLPCQILNPLPFYESCRSSYCRGSERGRQAASGKYLGGNRGAVAASASPCASAAAFVRQCRHLGVDVNRAGGWRTVDFCREHRTRLPDPTHGHWVGQ